MRAYAGRILRFITSRTEPGALIIVAFMVLTIVLGAATIGIILNMAFDGIALQLAGGRPPANSLPAPNGCIGIMQANPDRWPQA